MQNKTIQYHQRLPEKELSGFIESYWMLMNKSEDEKEIVVLPDGRIDVFFSKSKNEAFHISLAGIESKATQTTLAAKTIIFSISFKLLAVEFLFDKNVAHLLDKVILITEELSGFSEEDLTDFDAFCIKANGLLKTAFSKVETDTRKQKLFEEIYASKGSSTVKELAEKAAWSNRQINRYFNEYFGLNLKAYCNILRFRASFTQIKEGRFFPEENFSDQPHFIKEIKKYSGVIPKELNKNKNDRFIQLSLLSET